MKDKCMAEENDLLEQLAEIGKAMSKHQVALEKRRRQAGELCDEIYKVTGEQRFADASAHLRISAGHQMSAHASDDLAGCLALQWEIPQTNSR